MAKKDTPIGDASTGASTETPRGIDEYIARFPADVQEKLQKIRETLQ